MVPLTEKQAKVFQYIKDTFYSSGSMPTLREICYAMDWNAVGSAQTVIEALLAKGWIEREAQKARGLRLVETEAVRPAPILGSAPAGVPVEAIENHEGDVIVPAFLRGPVFAVRVKGDSMQDAGIDDGDLAIVRQSDRAENGEIVVASIQGEVTIKRFVRKGRELWLQPENPKYKPRLINDHSFRILGKVIGLHRYFEGMY